MLGWDDQIYLSFYSSYYYELYILNQTNKVDYWIIILNTCTCVISPLSASIGTFQRCIVIFLFDMNEMKWCTCSVCIDIVNVIVLYYILIIRNMNIPLEFNFGFVYTIIMVVWIERNTNIYILSFGKINFFKLLDSMKCLLFRPIQKTFDNYKI